MEAVVNVLETYSQLIPQFASVSSQFCEDSTDSLVSSLKYLCTEISSIHHGFSQWLNSFSAGSNIPRSCTVAAVRSEAVSSGAVNAEDCDEAVSGFLSKAESLVETMLLSVQSVVKAGQEGSGDAAGLGQDRETDSQQGKQFCLLSLITVSISATCVRKLKFVTYCNNFL